MQDIQTVDPDPNLVRKAAVAGVFYSDSSQQLSDDVDKLVMDAGGPVIAGDIKALVAPHAGYRFSGEVAARAFKQVAEKAYETVFVLCPSHRDHFSGVSAYAGEAYETPLGLVNIDRKRVSRLCEILPDIIHRSVLGHRDEHAIEVELPFLQRVLQAGWQLVPLVMGDYDAPLCRRLASGLVDVAGDDATLIVASSDLYHGYSHEQCVSTDVKTLEALERGDSDRWLDGLKSNVYQACGGGPIATAISAARELGADATAILGHTTSGDVTAQFQGYVVGYGAAVLYRDQAKDRGLSETLSEWEQTKLLNAARTAISDIVLHPTLNSPPEVNDMPPGKLREPGDAFVTVRLEGELRGCIGRTDSDAPLILTVHEVARAAATRDPRFSPLDPKDLENLTISISVLGQLKPLDNVNDLLIGQHGLCIRQGSTTGLLLPQVASDRSWDRTTFLQQTCAKAGLPIEAWLSPEAEVLYFQAQVLSEVSGEA
ncbi:MAG: AmmeMemoRadiSam system protein B [Candidatus Latescibacteria bacterium]|jgi:MEMO1 family protein|nr:AmmeMemoRadiSam system protein B [Candidatus Latescibacterota bacterium]